MADMLHSAAKKDASFGAHHKNLNEDRPILSAEGGETKAGVPYSPYFNYRFHVRKELVRYSYNFTRRFWSQ